MEDKKYIHLFGIFCFLVFVFLFSFVLRFLHLYERFFWMDIFMHFFGGFSIAYFFIEILKSFNDKIVLKNRFFEIAIVISLVALSAVLFEFYEFIINFIFHPIVPFQGTLEDTMSDLFFGIFGGLMMSLFRKV